MFVLLAGLSLGSPIGAHTPPGAVVPLSRDGLWEAYLHAYEPWAVADDGESPLGCTTTLVEMLKLRWDEFTPVEQSRMTSHIAPFLSDLRQPMVPRPLPEGAPLPPPGKQVCWGSYLDNQVQGSHFSVEWQSGTITQGEAQDFLDELEHSYEVEVEQLGWREPAGMDEFLLPVYVVEGWSASAYTTLNGYSCSGEYLPYIVAYEGSFFGGTWWMDMAAHEFNHASQFAYGNAMEFWYWEATATYMQEYVYPTHNEWAPYITGYSEQPYIAMSASDQVDYDVFYHMYGMAIWNFWIDENHGGLDAVLDIWEYAAGEGGYYTVSQQEALDGAGLDFAEVFKGFTAANTVMDYAEHNAFPSIRDQDRIDDLPAEGSSSSATAPESYGSNFLEFDLTDPTGDKTDLEFTFDGDEPANWLVQIVGANDDQVATIVEVELTESSGTGRLEDYGQYDEVWVVISPRKEASGDFEYSWSAAGALPLPDPVDDEGGEDGEATGTGGSTADPEVDAEGGGIFGCDSARGAHAGWAALAAAALVRRRYRSTGTAR